MRRKEELAVGEIYHIYNSSIAGFRILNSDIEFTRMENMTRYYQIDNMPRSYSDFMRLKRIGKIGFDGHFLHASQGREKLVRIITYCFMSTHVHFILKQLKKEGISIFMGNLLNSYARYYNIKHKRKGPLWESKFKNVAVKTDEQLLHLTRYIHLNPVTANLVSKPEHWPASSYNEYIAGDKAEKRICEYEGLLDIQSGEYSKFVTDQICYQRNLAQIKYLLLDG